MKKYVGDRKLELLIMNPQSWQQRLASMSTIPLLQCLKIVFNFALPVSNRISSLAVEYASLDPEDTTLMRLLWTVHTHSRRRVIPCLPNKI